MTKRLAMLPVIWGVSAFAIVASYKLYKKFAGMTPEEMSDEISRRVENSVYGPSQN